MSDKLPLAKRRDLGDIIQDSIKLLSHPHAQPLWRNILMFALPAYIVSGFFLGQFNVDMQEVLPELQSGQMTDPEEIFAAIFKIFGFHYYMAIFFSTIAGSLLTAVTYNFIAAYNQSVSGNIDADTIRSSTFADILWILGFQLLSGLIIGVSMLFFFIPGIYFAIILSILLIVAKNENLSFGEAFTRCRELMKDNWWNTFLLIIVVGFLVGMMSSLAGGVFQAIFLKIDKYMGMVFATILQNMLAGALGVFSAVAISLQYFNLVNYQEKGGVFRIYDDIDDIGK